MKTTLTLVICLALFGFGRPPSSGRAVSPDTPRSTSSFQAESQLQAPDGRKSTIEDIVRQCSGKVVCVDIWASWCGPCLQQGVYFQALRQTFSGQPVVFLSISIDTDPEAWQQCIEEHGWMTDPDTYILLDPRHSGLNARLNIRSIPRYIILDKTGRLVDANAPSPGDARLSDKIQQLLAAN